MLTLTTLRALKGAPLSIVIAMLIANQPVGENWLCSITGYSPNTIRKGCQFLVETQMIKRNERYQGYALTNGAMQLPLGMEEIGECHKLTLPSVTTTTAFNRNEEENNEENAVEGRERVSKIDTRASLEERSCSKSTLRVTENDARLVLLYSAGIMEPTASKLLENAWVTREYLDAHIERANRESTPVGLLIHRIRSHDPKPEVFDEYRRPKDYRKSWLGSKN